MKKVYPINPIVEHLDTQADKKNPSIERMVLFTPLTEDQYNHLDSAMTRYATLFKNDIKKQEMNDALYKQHHFTFDGILAVGDTQMDVRQANTLIHSIKTRINGIEKNNYKCFVNANWQESNDANIIYHEDGGCSWNCLIQKLKNPKYGVIFSIPLRDKSKFKIQ